VDTSGDGIPNIVLYLVVLALFVQVGLRLLRATPGPRRFPVVAVVFTVVVGAPSLLQFAWPAIYDALHREPALTLQHGQWWRVLSSVVAQDGGLAAALFNLVVVAFVTALAEWIWGRWRTVVLFLLPSILLNLLALAWNDSGGGSSFASDGLLMSMCGLGLMVSKSVVVRVCSVAAIAIGVVLVAIDDAHGVAILLGAVLGILFAIPRRRRAASGA
jgi:membrane associated rhomboid family serine protease